MYGGIHPSVQTSCHTSNNAVTAISEGMLALRMLGDLFADGQNIPFGTVDHLDIGRNFFRAGSDGDMLTFFCNVHQLVIVIALDGGFEGPYVIVQTGAFDKGDESLKKIESIKSLNLLIKSGLTFEALLTSFFIFLLANERSASL